MKILYVCSEFYAGMMPFGATIVNTMQKSEHEIFGVFVCSPQCNYRNSVIDNYNANFIFIDTPMDKIRRGYFRLFGFPIIKAIKKICRENEIDAIHLLTEDSSLAYFIKSMNYKLRIYYTVHDLKQHESKPKNFIKKAVNYLLVERRSKFLIKNIDHLVTCSKDQYKELINTYKQKKVYYHNFPSLVTTSIINGKKLVPELKNINNYILFFGRIELYKGIDILYDEYCKNNLLSTRSLVIAGSGGVYFKRDENKENNITFINRYIDDEELNDLFNGAHSVIYPYISATQSGVLSLAYHFNKPVIVSNVPFFRECLTEGQTGYSFDINNPATMGEMFSKLENFEYQQSDYYNIDKLREQLDKIYKYE
ncbi:glycosyltransferase family 4 protein [Flavobacterium zhairuonense]|uniref:glycosyltransferase family 4 protein n=1 Tax=Flavobacterium zhairuonense TaxID=2493631 RepID=UPI00104535EA|nr:glycosyltransferase family 4 protein [Flavobacterium zhairuonense]KAF2509241.1 glycosyltransferase family 4 protein [Flavobacterium zhairuonense]